MVIYSHSRLSTYEQCPLKFKFRYIDELEEGDSIEAFMGKQVHETLFFIYTKVKEKRFPTLHQALIFYKDLWDKEFHQNIKIVKRDLTAKDYFEKGLIFLEQYYRKHIPFDENILSMEKRILIDLEGDGKYMVQGFIDKLIYNEQENVYEIHDYKTSNWLKSQEELDQDRQLALYSLGLKDLYPDADKIALKWYFLKHGVEKTSFRTNEQLEELKNSIKILINEIESAQEWPAKKSKLCDWCGFKNRCPAYQEEIDVESLLRNSEETFINSS